MTYSWYCEGFSFQFNTAAEIEAHVANLKKNRNLSGAYYTIRRIRETNPTVYVKSGYIS